MSSQTIGVLGGMGPRATVQFESMLLDSFEGSDQDMPTIISVNDGSIPDRSNFILGRGKDPVPILSKNIRLLESGGASIVCIPCNTACSDEILTRVTRRPTTNIIDLPVCVVDTLQKYNTKRVMLLATEGTIQSNRYQTLCRLVGIDCIVPEVALQQSVSKVILAVKSNLTIDKRITNELQTSIIESGAEAVILGCTELPLVRESIVPANVQAIDTLEVLVAATKELIYKNEKGAIR